MFLSACARYGLIQINRVSYVFFFLFFFKDKKPADEPAQKLTPIIVTAKKIISLKKKPNDQSVQPAGEVGRSTTTNSQLSPNQVKQVAVVRKLPTATILPETKRPADVATSTTTAVVRPVVKHVAKRPAAQIIEDLEDYDEDELLADSPPASPVKVVMKPLGSSGSTRSSHSAANSRTISNRRVVVRNAGGDTTSGAKKLIISSTKAKTGGETDHHPKDEPIDVDEIKSIVQSTASSHHKGIFGRLDKKLIGVNDAAKRKIQRIVINNSE